MGKKSFFLIFLILFFFCQTTPIASYQTKLSVFHFTPVNLDAAVYGTTVTNMLVDYIKTESSMVVLGRKELETFLYLNDLQQSDDVKNALDIGARLGLDAIVIGSVAKKGPVISINCKVLQIAQKKIIMETRVRLVGESGLSSEIRKLSRLITAAISRNINVDIPKIQSIPKAAKKTGSSVNIKARPGSLKISLSWDDPPGIIASGYKIYRSISKSGPFAKIAQVTEPEYIDQGLMKNSTYYYKIKVYDSKGQLSDSSKIISATTALTPHSPIIFNTDSRIKSIQITWAPNPIKSKDPSQLKGYKLYQSKKEGGSYKEIGNILGKDMKSGKDKVTYLDKNLVDGEDYYYKLTAYNEKDMESDFSSTIRGTAINIINGVSSEGDMIREIKLSWNPAKSGHVKGYFIYRSTEKNNGFSKIKKLKERGTKNFTDDKELGDLTPYYYYVTAFDSSLDETAPSEIVSAITKGKPSVPKNLKAESGLAKKVRLAWPANPQEEIKGYKLYRSINRRENYVLIKKISGRNSNKFLDQGISVQKLDDKTTYYYQLTTYNKVDVESLMSEVASATTKPRPTRPIGLKGESLQVKVIPLTWLHNPEKDIVSYHIFRSEEPDEKYSRVSRVKREKNKYLDKRLKDGQQYYYKIQAEDKDGLLSDMSDTISVKTKPRPKSPEGLTADYQGGMVNLSWMPNNEPDIGSYIVYKKGFSEMTKIAIVEETKFSDSGLAPGKEATYSVTAVDKDGLESEPSQKIAVVGE